MNLSTEMGRVSCVFDANAAAERDAALRAADAPPEITLPGLAAGLRAADGPLAGARAVQGTVRLGDRSGRFNDLVGHGFVLLARQPAALPAEHARFLERTGVQVVVLEEVEDLDGRLTAWLDEHGVEAVLVRPDGYVFGAVATLDSLPTLVDDLRAQLHTTDEGAPTMPADTQVTHPQFPHVNQEADV